MNKKEPARDDEDDSDTSDDPLLASLDRDLNKALKDTDRRLFLFVGVALAAAFLPNYLSVPQVAADILAALSIVAVFGGIAFTIWLVLQRKQAVAKRYGLHCVSCGNKPRVSEIMLTAQVNKCSRCNRDLNVHIP